MIKKVFLYLVIFISILFFSGCNTSTDTTISSSKNQNIESLGSNNKDTLGVSQKKEMSLKDALLNKRWREIVIDLDEFYMTISDTNKKSYIIDMSFSEDSVIAYADCFKLSARYKISDNKISFSKISYGQAIELAVCQESEDANEAVFQLFSNDFTATKIEDDKILFYSQELEADIELKL